MAEGGAEPDAWVLQDQHGHVVFESHAQSICAKHVKL